MKITYTAPVLDYSGYGEASRNIVAALHTAGADVHVNRVAYSPEGSDFGKVGALMRELIDNDTQAKINILHTTPDQYKKHIVQGSYNIGHFFWETDKVPDQFAEGLKLVDEIWTGSKANVDAIRKARGLENKTITVFPQPIDVDREAVKPYKIEGMADDTFLFYSIFEWTDRKNPEGLLNAFYEEFDANDGVALLIKTYFRSFTSHHRKTIYRKAERIRDKFIEAGKLVPKVYFYFDLMDRHHIQRLHETGDCFISLHRGEGWGVPQVEAGLAGNPIISTSYGGCHEYFNDSECFKIDYKMIAVRGMEHSAFWYSADQKWADPDIKQARKAMRESMETGKHKGSLLKESITEQFNYKKVGDMMVKRLKKIEGQI